MVNVAGDGDFLMTGQELATATGYGAGRGWLISIVVDNGSYGTIRMHQERDYPGRVSGSDLFNPDFAALARAYGWHGRAGRAHAPTSSPRCRAPLAAGRPALLHLKLDTDVITSRAHAVGDSRSGTAPAGLNARTRCRPDSGRPSPAR